MSTSINEPYVLSSYGLHGNFPKGGTELNRGPCLLNASYGHGSLNGEGHATITAQGDGIHVLEVSGYVQSVLKLKNDLL